MAAMIRDRPTRYRTTNYKEADRGDKVVTDRRNSLVPTDHRTDHRDSLVSAVERGDVRWFTDRVKSALQWDRLTPHLPPWPGPQQATPTVDHVVGLVLHCVILSAVVLGAAAVRAARGLAKFVCYVTLHWCIYRGEILPICENTPGPITLGRIENATLMESHGFRVILISSRPQSPLDTSVPSASPPHCLSLSDYTSGTNSLADLSQGSRHRSAVTSRVRSDDISHGGVLVDACLSDTNNSDTNHSLSGLSSLADSLLD